MRKYVVTKTEIFEMIVEAKSRDDAEDAARMGQEFEFIEDEYSVKEVGD